MKSAVQYDDFITLIDFLQKPTQQMQPPEHDNFSSRPVNNFEQFQTKIKLPRIVAQAYISPNKMSIVIQLMNNLILIANKSKIIAISQNKYLLDVPNVQSMKWKLAQRIQVPLTIINQELLLFATISDFGDLYLQYEKTQIYFQYEKNVFLNMNIFQPNQKIANQLQYKETFSGVFASQTPHLVDNEDRLVIARILFNEKEVILDIANIYQGEVKNMIRKTIRIQNQAAKVETCRCFLNNIGSNILILLNQTILSYNFDVNNTTNQQFDDVDQKQETQCANCISKPQQQQQQIQSFSIPSLLKKNNKSVKSLAFVDYCTSPDSNIQALAFKEFIIVFTFPTVLTLIDQQFFDPESCQIEIVNHRKLTVKTSPNGYTSYSLNALFDKNELVVHPDRYCTQTMIATVLQLHSMKLGDLELGDAYRIVEFLMTNVTQMQLMVLLGESEILADMLLEQFQLDIQMVGICSQIIAKFVQLLVMECKSGNKVNIQKLLQFKVFMNGFGYHPLSVYITRQFSEQFTQYFTNKYSLQYFISQLENYSNEYEKSITKLNFEENYDAAQQILVFVQIMSEINLRNHQYLNFDMAALACQLFGLAFDISSAKQIKTSAIIKNKYIKLLQYCGLGEIAAYPQLPQLPAILILLMNPQVKLYNAQRLLKSVLCRPEEIFQALVEAYAYMINQTEIEQKSNSPISQFKLSILQKQSQQKNLLVLQNSKHLSEEQIFFFEYLIYSNQIGKLFSILLDENARIQLLQTIYQFKSSQVINQITFSFSRLLYQIVFSIANGCKIVSNFENCVLKTQDIQDWIRQDKLELIFTSFGYSILSLSNTSYAKASILLTTESTQHAIKYLDYVVTLLDLLKMKGEGNNIERRDLIRLRGCIKEQQPILQRNKNNILAKSNIASVNATDISIDDLRHSQAKVQSYFNQPQTIVNNVSIKNNNQSLIKNENNQKSQMQQQIIQEDSVAQQSLLKEESGVNDIDPGIAQKIMSYDPNKEVSQVQLEGNSIMQPQEQSFQQQEQPQSFVSERPMQIKRIRVSDLGKKSIQQQQQTSQYPSDSLIQGSYNAQSATVFDQKVQIPSALYQQQQQKVQNSSTMQQKVQIPNIFGQQQAQQTQQKQSIPQQIQLGQQQKPQSSQQLQLVGYSKPPNMPRPAQQSITLVPPPQTNRQVINVTQNVQNQQMASLKYPQLTIYNPQQTQQNATQARIPIVIQQPVQQQAPRQLVQVQYQSQPIQQTLQNQNIPNYQQTYQQPTQQNTRNATQAQTLMQQPQQCQPIQFIQPQQPVQQQNYRQAPIQNIQQPVTQQYQNNQQIVQNQVENEQDEVQDLKPVKQKYNIYYAQKSYKKPKAIDLAKIEGAIGPGIPLSEVPEGVPRAREINDLDYINRYIDQVQPIQNQVQEPPQKLFQQVYQGTSPDAQQTLYQNQNLVQNQMSNVQPPTQYIPINPDKQPHQDIQQQSNQIRPNQAQIQQQQLARPVKVESTPNAQNESMSSVHSIRAPNYEQQIQHVDFKPYQTPLVENQFKLGSQVIGNQVFESVYDNKGDAIKQDDQDDVLRQLDEMMAKAKSNQQQAAQFMKYSQADGSVVEKMQELHNNVQKDSFDSDSAEVQGMTDALKLFGLQ